MNNLPFVVANLDMHEIAFHEEEGILNWLMKNDEKGIETVFLLHVNLSTFSSNWLTYFSQRCNLG